MLAKKYRSELISISNPFEDIYTLKFASKRGNFKYFPGQFLHLAIDEDYDGIGQWPESRCFSMQSSPEEKTLRITYAVKGSFTQQMKHSLMLGSEIWLKLPYGDLFSQKHNKENTVFIAGGTGVTPFLSLFTHKSFSEYTNPRIYLGFRSTEHNVYHGEINFLNKLRDSKNGSVTIHVFYEKTNGIIDISRKVII